MNQVFFNDTEYNQLIEKLAINIHNSNFQPSMVLAIARGGTRVGDILSRIYQVPLVIITASSYTGTTRGNLEVYNARIISTLSGNVLIADDLVDSGTTLLNISDLVSKNPSVNSVHTATIWYKKDSVYTPDSWVDKVNPGCWIVQPFEKYDRESFLETLLKLGPGKQ